RPSPPPRAAGRAGILPAPSAAPRPGGGRALGAGGERANAPAGRARAPPLYGEARRAPARGARRNLRRGDTGPAVRALQSALRAAGVDLVPDGIFAAATEAALRDFQRRAGLAATGAAGAETRRRLEEYPPSGDPSYRMQA